MHNGRPMDLPRSDFDYFSRRCREELAAAEQANDPRARQCHLDLAERYADAARASGSASLAADMERARRGPAPLLAPEFRILP